ncbi:MAG TPA: glycogen-binding domain-containing protein [Gemmatimonadaceae bacterium]|nr:glycogen-binding domain-containing protein [Gemmatimonadaceae bacterium]
MRCAGARLAVALGVASILAAPALCAQTYLGVDVSGATVHYDGFLSSGALSVSPSLLLVGSGGTLAAQATLLRFQSGHTSVQGVLAGATYLRLGDRLLAELSGEGGSSSYRSFSPFVHGMAQFRLHLLTSRSTGVWAAGEGGEVRYQDVRRGLWTSSAGGWMRVRPALLSAAVSHADVGDTTYTDVQGNLLIERGPLQLTGDAGVRAWSVGAGRGVYGEVGATWWMTDHLALTASGGRYPADPLRGTIAGRYVALGVRIGRRIPSPLGARATHAGSSDVPLDPPAPTTRTAVAEGGTGEAIGTGMAPAVAHFDVNEAPERGDRMQLLHVVAPAARAVEVMGDFTEWRPVALTATGGGAWEVALPIAPGIHRVNIRVNGGAWVAPPGLAVASDDFGGVVGLLPIGNGP